MTMIKFKPSTLGVQQPFGSIWDDMSLIFDRLPAGSSNEKASFFPLLDLKEDDQSFTLSTELPGMNEKDIDISYQEGVLTLRGERKSESKKENENHIHVERSFGSFYRSVNIPSAVDEKAIKASYKNGVLEVKLPKVEIENKVHKIKIQS